MAPAKPQSHQLKRQRKKELVVLSTSTPSPKEQEMIQDKAMAICKCRLIKPFIVLETDPSKVNLITSLLEMSVSSITNNSNNYPQFFFETRGKI
jgi:hypothetical protein